MTLRTQLSKNSATFVEKNKSIVEKENSIKDKACGREDLENLKREILGNIKKIEYEYEETEKNSKKIEKQYNECSSSIIAAQKNLVSLNERCADDLENLRKALSEEKIENIVEAKNNYMSKDKIEELKIKIEQYRNASVKIIGTIENLNTKIGDRSLSEDRWIEIQSTRDKNTETLEKLKKDKIELEREVKDIDEKIGQLTKLLNKKQKLEYELSLLDDLDKLFKGKKFVEFVAQNQLKYISIEADKRLKEITCGNYGLEVDKDGRFIIRDYKNGGAQRDASTLSGGETFVTSLALALALSAQIQLKGSAPLELFFLDEGFGTLDDNLLEVVMDSLEKIHNDRLSIGIISHLESIKDRMPVKLIVAPAEAGMGGSKVKIEIN
nr:TPA_exp: nuclease SbcCD subunit C [Clostridium autoethanogenum DSM 10061]